MPINKKSNYKLLSYCAGLALFSGCEIPTNIDVIDGIKQGDGVETIADSCYREHYTQPDQVLTSKLDVLFVVDTSGSIENERIQIANRIDNFVEKLPEDFDYRLGVVLSHGNRSSWSGKLYVNSPTAPAVYDSEIHSLESIRNGLKSRLTKTPSDYFSDGGETAFYSLYQASSGDQLAKNKAAGMFRADAGLAIIFVSDENEICAQYPDGITPAKDYNTYKGKTLEDIAKNENCTIQTSSGASQYLSTDFMIQHLRSLKGDQPVSIGAIIHTDKDPKAYLPVSSKYINSKTGKSSISRRPMTTNEDEFGYGYAEIVEKTNGGLIDIWQEDYSSGLSSFGEKVAKQMQVFDSFQLSNSPVLEDSIQAFVDGELGNHSFDLASNSVRIENPGVAKSEIVIDYCLKTIIEPPVEPPVEVITVPVVVDPGTDTPPIDDPNGDLPPGCTAISCDVDV